MSLFIHIVSWVFGIAVWLSVGILVMIKIVLPTLDRLYPDPPNYGSKKEPTDSQLGWLVLLLLICSGMWPVFLAVTLLCLVVRGLTTTLGKAARKVGF